MIKKIAILCSIFLNLCIVRWEPMAIRMTWEAVGSQTFTFYTENSNVFAFFVCLLVAVCQVICLFTGRQLPRWVKTLKYIATCCLTMTFLTVVFVLGPYCADQGGVVFLRNSVKKYFEPKGAAGISNNPQKASGRNPQKASARNK